MKYTSVNIHDLPDDVLELVLLHAIRTPFCLARAAATCKLWRRVIAGDAFLHRVRSLHRRDHLLGHYTVKTTEAAGFSRTDIEFVPFPARPAVHLRRRLSLDFLVDGEHVMRGSAPPMLTDSRGGLLAFVRDHCSAVVCDPWTRQSTLLEFPWARRPGGRECMYACLGAFILDAGDGDNKSSLMSSFSVLCACLILDEVDNTMTAEACVFSARDNGWIRRTVNSDVCRDVAVMDMDQRFVGRAGGSIFFSGVETIDDQIDVLLVLDEATGDFSTIMLPPWSPDYYGYNYSLFDDRKNIRVANGAAGALARIVRLVDDIVLEVLKVTRDQQGDWECMVERSVDLWQRWENRSWTFLDTIDGHMTSGFCTAQARHGPTAAGSTLVLSAFSPSSTTLLFHLDVQTMKLKRANKMMTSTLNANRVFPYELPWLQTIK